METKESIIFLTGTGVIAWHQLINTIHYAIILVPESYTAKPVYKYYLCFITLIKRFAILPGKQQVLFDRMTLF